MGKKQSQSTTTPKKEPQPTVVSSEPNFPKVVAEMAWQVAIPFMVLTLGGSWLDTRYDSKPLFTIIGLLLGVASVTLIVFRLVRVYYPNTFKKDDK